MAGLIKAMTFVHLTVSCRIRSSSAKSCDDYLGRGYCSVSLDSTIAWRRQADFKKAHALAGTFD